ncbi:MAG: GAF domain-containing protein [Nitrospiraceae bacterium]|nr:GAF domain-containing protein [Nitrospiraceae bacterium]
MSLRTKFVVFFALILILTCSTLSWHFVESRRVFMTDSLHQLGRILVTSVVNNGQFRYGALIAEDRMSLQQFTESLIAVDDVVYVVIRGTDGMILAQQNKLVRESAGNLTFTQERRFYPDEHIALRLYQAPVTVPLITPVQLSSDNIFVTGVDSSDGFPTLPSITAQIYDVAMPVLRRAATDPSLSPLPLELEEGTARSEPLPARVQGTLQIGLSDAQAKQALLSVIRNALILTAFIIGAGIVGAHVLTQRVTTPLRSLASVARQLAEGENPQPLIPTSNDEVGQLAGLFNTMTRTLRERNRAIHANLTVIQRQISQLTAVHQTSAAVSSTLDLQQLLDTVLQLLMTNLGFGRMLLMLRREDQPTAYVAQVAGVSPDIAEAARMIEVPIQEGDTVMADLLLHGKPVHVHDLNDFAAHMHPDLLALARQVRVTSFVAVPLQTRTGTVGFLAGDRETSACTADDLSILATIASHVASAIDNARAYSRLTELTQHLEQRIRDRTHELSMANERLQEHDRRRSMFISVASHELRTPMTAIRSFADNMLDGVAGTLTERQRMYLTRIGHNLNRLTRIINQLLDWSRLDLHKEELLQRESICLRQLTVLVVESLRPVAAEKQVHIQVQASDVPALQGDRDKLEQVLWNLIGNAVKFTPSGGQVTVQVEATCGGFVNLCVADTGCGIPPEYLDRVFDEFSKVPSPMPTAQGAQLGLFITKTLVMMHGGKIGLESTPATGTRVVVTLPCEPHNAEAVGTSVCIS